RQQEAHRHVRGRPVGLRPHEPRRLHQLHVHQGGDVQLPVHQPPRYAWHHHREVTGDCPKPFGFRLSCPQTTGGSRNCYCSAVDLTPPVRDNTSQDIFLPSRSKCPRHPS